MTELHLPRLVFALVLLLASGLAAHGQEPVPEPRTEHRLTVALATTGGEVPDDLGPKDFAFEVGGEPESLDAVISAADAGPWQVVVYLDAALANADEVRRAATALADSAARLAALGSVTIVRAAPEPQVVLPATDDPAAIDASLGQAALLGDTVDSLRELRRRYFQRLLYLRQRRDVDPNGDEALGQLVAEAVHDEVTLVTRQQDHLLTFLAGRGPGEGRRALILVTGGFDLEARQFYLDQLPEEIRTTVAAAAPRRPLDGITDAWGQGLAVLGWQVYPLQLPPAKATEPDTEDLAYDRYREASADSGTDRSVAPPAWQTISLQKIRRQLLGSEEQPEPRGPLLLDPKTPLDLVAGATGGRTITERQELLGTLEGLGKSALVDFQLSAGDDARPISLTSRRPGLEVRTAQWTGEGVPTAVAAARARRLLAGEPADGALRLAATLRKAPGGRSVVETRADLSSLVDLRTEAAEDRGNAGGTLPEAADATLDEETPVEVRLTIAQGSLGGPVSVVHERRWVDRPFEPWQLSVPVEPIPGVDRVAVVLEDVDGVAWGGVLAADLREAGAATDDDQGDGVAPALDEDELGALAEAAYLPRDQPIRLLPPSSEVLRGKVRFQTLVSDDSISRVEFYLDGERAEVARRPPFEANLKLGKLPRPHTVRVVAYDVTGREVGNDTLSINDLGRGFRVHIVDPQPGRATGAVDVRMDLDLPADRRLDRLEVSWNDRRIATLYGPPFRQRLVIPADHPEGFVRAVAYLDDGRTSEDVVFLNQRDFAERVQIRLVELYTVVTDANGRPVKGLTADKFTVREAGEVQEIADFDDAGDLPLTLGLTIDSSASMFVKLPAVKQAAGDFVRGFLSGRDRAFLVDFDTEPRMVRPMTSDLYRVVDGIEGLEADGDTHLWESIVYSLMELQSSAGKKALVVFSDGAEEEEALSFRTCQRFAQRLGVPIYLIVLHPGIARGDDLTASVKAFTRKLERLAGDTGGRAYFIPNTDHLDAIYREIDTELRSQYLLTYYAKARTDGDDEWREVTVDVEGKGLEARTISGYFPSF
ncbi:MAG: VWA domain-containing protein [Acidobacteria bacterium]|nr:VWA domain-containing protein [Acidobacteriota bacterium]